MSLGDFVSLLTDAVFPFIIDTMGDCLSTITSNPLFLFPILLSLAAAGIFFVIKLIRKFGVRGAASSGRSRRRRRAA